MAEPTFFESLMKTLKVGEPPKKSKKEYTIPETSPLFGGTTLEFSSEIDPDILKQREKEADRDRKRREEEARKSLVKETVDAAKTTEEEVPVPKLPKPPKPPKTGQNPDETGTGGTEGNDKGGTIVEDKILDPKALRKRRSLVSRVATRGLLAGEDENQMMS